MKHIRIKWRRHSRILTWPAIAHTVGTACVAIAFVIATVLYVPIIAQRLAYDVKGTSLFTNLKAPGPDTTVRVPSSFAFGLLIPKLNINVPIVADVDGDVAHAYYTSLREGVAHYKTTAKPDAGGNTVIFGHSSYVPGTVPTPYSDVFLLLDKLVTGDQLTIYYANHPYLYVVKEVKTTPDTAFEILDQHVPRPRVTLFTCWPPGTDLKRMVVVAEQTGT